MDPLKEDEREHQHKDQDSASQKQEPPKQQPAEDESHLIPPNRTTSPTSTISSGYGPTLGMFPAHDEGLPEVVPDTTPQALSRLEAEYKRKYLDGDAPQTVIPKDMDTAKVAVIGGEEQYVVTPDGAPGDVEGAPPGKRAGARICGLRRKTFWILLIIAIVVVAAAVGGGVGGGLSAKNSKEKTSSGDAEGASTTGSNTSTPTSTPKTSSTSTTTSSSPTPTFLNNQTASGNTFAFQAFSDDTFLGKATAVIDDEGGRDLGFEAHSYVWVPSLTDCCITFCTNATSKGMVGWLCSQRKQPKSSDPFKRVYVWCHQKHEKANAICIDPKT
ncbi:fungal specific transcription factor domain-containing [Trichoderma arundinaceum]|uniref:Fungal specific transcription factor domain-containing n=1 Tax=Trichoderma arundinaceum TaxID=490622 RepID=A0A395NH05_TRIAR|nr:fungal specific transcription factor domain-containing [Trichoderma arundinaceum]